ncbi:hypothetical protein MLD38_038745 [Melastoma candidum]|uniref:Uncharacterized protein n=1 Tax=Melastoma candidum TaxID=119954 RepID=A0ACB9L114_9MYRT|nr:hypothetical protein MLD38_038745 [Melastoma candidum]
MGTTSWTQAYGESSYWNKRYAGDSKPFDCEQMVDDGYEDVVNVDVSSVVIDEMKRKYANRPQLRYMVMDVRDMNAFESASFDAVIDEDASRSGKITYGSPTYRLHFLRQINLWAIKLHVIENFLHDKKSQHQWEVTKPVPLDGDDRKPRCPLYLCLWHG